MKIILSRKGIDGGIGKKPSPLLNDQNFLAPISIPIFDDYSKIESDEVTLSGNKLTDLIGSLGVNQDGLRFIHLDPDLDEKSIPRKKGWRAMYGQSSAALSHLNKHTIGLEDLFLFFGWFKETEKANGVFKYKENAPDIHSFFGWLQVGEVLDADGKSFESLELKYPWGHRHPHFGKKNGFGHGNIYLAKEFLQLEGQPVTSLPGAGIFRRFTNQAQLTFEGERKRSIWKLPAFFHKTGEPFLTYHQKEERWTKAGNDWRLETVGRGQEFVFSPNENREAVFNWVMNLIQKHA